MSGHLSFDFMRRSLPHFPYLQGSRSLQRGARQPVILVHAQRREVYHNSGLSCRSNNLSKDCSLLSLPSHSCCSVGRLPAELDRPPCAASMNSQSLRESQTLHLRHASQTGGTCMLRLVDLVLAVRLRQHSENKHACRRAHSHMHVCS